MSGDSSVTNGRKPPIFREHLFHCKIINIKKNDWKNNKSSRNRKQINGILLFKMFIADDFDCKENGSSQHEYTLDEAVEAASEWFSVWKKDVIFFCYDFNLLNFP